MKHKEYKRIVDGADTAVLFIHGIVGTPNHFKVYWTLVPKEYSIYSILLDGHGKGVREFSKTSMKIWESQVNNVVGELMKNHKRVLIAAHSMGCLFAIEQAFNKREVEKLFLLSPPMNVHVRFIMIKNALKMYFNKIGINDVVALATKNCCGVNLSKNLFLYFGWIPRFLELFSKIRKTRSLLCNFKKPVNVFISFNDELVSEKSAKYFKNCENAKIIYLENSGHFYYAEQDLTTLKNIFNEFVK